MIKSKFLDGKLSDYSSITDIPEEMIGKISSDRSAIVGKNGWCFIYEGSNDYHNSYCDESLFGLGESWSRLIESRQRICDRLGIQFLQIIVPNKLSVLPDCFTEHIKQDITFPLKGVFNANTDANLLIPIDVFRKNILREAIFRKNDSHFTIAGNAVLAELILNKLCLNEFFVNPIETSLVTHTGDLGGKFTPGISEGFHAPVWTNGLLDQKYINKVREVLSNCLTGTEQQFVNNAAPIKKKIIIFGNSFFEKIPSWGLSPLFSSIFQNYSFVWSSEFQEEKIKDWSPDIVICQTCERFLIKAPADKLVDC